MGGWERGWERRERERQRGKEEGREEGGVVKRERRAPELEASRTETSIRCKQRVQVKILSKSVRTRECFMISLVNTSNFTI